MAETRRGVYPAPINDPHADATTQPFWDAALEGRLVASRCVACHIVVLPPQPRCFNCQGKDFDWVELPGTGIIYSYTVVRHPLLADLAEVVPYVSAVVELDGTQGAGARLSANIIDCDPDLVAIGDKVRVVFETTSASLAVPRFVPDP